MTLFITSIRDQGPCSGSRACRLHVPLSISLTLSLSFHPLFFAHLLSLSIGVYCVTPAVHEYVNVLAGKQGPVQICSMTEHLKTPIDLTQHTPLLSFGTLSLPPSLPLTHAHTRTHLVAQLHVPLITLTFAHTHTPWTIVVNHRQPTPNRFTFPVRFPPIGNRQI